MTKQFNIELRGIETLRPYEHNPRLNDGAVDAVADSLQEFGFRQPIVVDSDGVIVCGHTRYKAALKLGLAKVPVHVAKDLTPEQIRAYRIADNKTADLAEWNYEILPIELSELMEAGFDMSLLAFDEKELTQLLNAAEVKQGNCDPDQIPDPPDEPITQSGDLWVLGNHRLLCGDAGSQEDLDRLLDGQVIHLINTDPPYNVKVEPRSNTAIAAGLSSFTNKKAQLHHQGFDQARGAGDPKKARKKMRAKDRPLENDFLSAEDFNEMLRAWFNNMARVLVPGGSFYIWGGYANLGNYPKPLQDAGLYFSQGIVWDKQHPVLTRKDFMGAFEICQPPDTQVMTPAGTTALSALRDGDEVITYAKGSGAIIGHRRGPTIRVGTRTYGGPLYGITVGSNTTWCTDGHLFSVRLVPHARSIWCVYLMRRGRWWRVGKTKLLTTWGLGLKQRLDMENGEEAWILSTHDTNCDAACAEQVVSARYGIPTTFWVEAKTCKRTHSQITSIYDRFDPMALHRGALWALSDHHRRIEYPFIHCGNTRPKYGRRVSFLTRACNLLPDAMEVPVPAGGPKYRWIPIRHVDVQDYAGPVYSLDVDRYHHYIADGIVTHNCFYGWKLGKGHRFFGPNNAPDLWHVKKIPPQKMDHLTAKPVELAVRAIQYSSKQGENVLDLFGGSGSTLIACQQTDRKAFLMELDPLYCDVIVQRFENFTGLKAQRISPESPNAV
ncbi:MAG: DNA methyltransferase [Anaerohalosphaeraceae bacterium]|nr:DNA methyltransferase [Anaerohalosphaeraceae bacterium]